LDLSILEWEADFTRPPNQLGGVLAGARTGSGRLAGRQSGGARRVAETKHRTAKILRGTLLRLAKAGEVPADAQK
jgi:hypothetical protein